MAAWQFELAGKVIRIGDVEIDEIEEAIAGTDVNWLHFMSHPFESAKALKSFLKHMADKLDVELPPLTYDQLEGLVKRVDDDLPDTYTDGMPDPKAGGQTTE